MIDRPRRPELGSPDQVRGSAKRSLVFGIVAVAAGIVVMAITTKFVLSVVIICFGAANLAGAIAMRRWADRQTVANQSGEPEETSNS